MRSGCSCRSIHFFRPILPDLLRIARPRAEGQAVQRLLDLLGPAEICREELAGVGAVLLYRMPPHRTIRTSAAQNRAAEPVFVGIN